MIQLFNLDILSVTGITSLVWGWGLGVRGWGFGVWGIGVNIIFSTAQFFDCSYDI